MRSHCERKIGLLPDVPVRKAANGESGLKRETSRNRRPRFFEPPTMRQTGRENETRKAGVYASERSIRSWTSVIGLLPVFSMAKG